MSKTSLLFASSRILILLLIFCTLSSKAQSNNPTSASCSSSSCGNITSIRYPFRLNSDPSSCGYNNPSFVLECQNNQTILRSGNRNFRVQEIDYEYYSIRLVDPNIIRGNLSSCPPYPNEYYDWPWATSVHTILDNVDIAFIHCLNPVNSTWYVAAPFCGNLSNIFSNSSIIYSYVIVADSALDSISNLEDSCTVDRVDWASVHGPFRDNSSLSGIYDSLGYGFDLSWFGALCGECEMMTNGHCSVEGTRISCKHRCREDLPISQLTFRCQVYSLVSTLVHSYLPWLYHVISVLDNAGQVEYWRLIIGIFGSLAVAGILALRFFLGFPFLMGLAIYKWKRQHLSMDETIEEFLRGQNNLTPIRYTYSEIKKMTNNFNQRLGEGGYGIVYKGKLRSGPYAAVKMMGQSISSEEDFIGEVGTIGRIHHVNVVQLIGFCAEGSKRALVYEYLPNGSLDRYIFSQQSLEASALRYEKMFEIALGVAHGINYLHHGCDMQILHFDIKPHNILLDEKFNPKISDFGLAKLYQIGDGFVNLAGARGTMGYMAPEMFYTNIGGVSYKADVYSFGMLLMEMAGRRKNTNPFADEMSQIYFPSWAYDQLHAGNEIEIMDATEEERKMVKKIIIVALWCIQMKPSDRPSMNKVVEMLEIDNELPVPPKPFLAPREITEEHEIKEKL